MLILISWLESVFICHGGEHILKTSIRSKNTLVSFETIAPAILLITAFVTFFVVCIGRSSIVSLVIPHAFSPLLMFSGILNKVLPSSAWK